MTPKEKAEYLMTKYYNLITLYTPLKKVCLAVCDEIIDLDGGDSVDKDYWYEVKTEIEKM